MAIIWKHNLLQRAPMESPVPDQREIVRNLTLVREVLPLKQLSLIIAHPAGINAATGDSHRAKE
jgi:hypothetical protein